LPSAMTDFSDFIDSCNLIDLPLGGRFTWLSHEEMPVLSLIDRSLFTCDWEDHFEGMHQVLLRITFRLCSKEEPLLQSSVLLSSKICGLRWMAFVSW